MQLSLLHVLTYKKNNITTLFRGLHQLTVQSPNFPTIPPINTNAKHLAQLRVADLQLYNREQVIAAMVEITVRDVTDRQKYDNTSRYLAHVSRAKLTFASATQRSGETSKPTRLRRLFACPTSSFFCSKKPLRRRDIRRVSGTSSRRCGYRFGRIGATVRALEAVETFD